MFNDIEVQYKHFQEPYDETFRWLLKHHSFDSAGFDMVLRSFHFWPFHNVFSLRFYDCLEGPYVFAGGKSSGPREAKGKRRAKVQ